MKYARINDESTTEISSYLERGKIYEITDYDTKGCPTFTISSDQHLEDDGTHAFCLVTGCPHIYGGNWELFEELPETNLPKEKVL